MNRTLVACVLVCGLAAAGLRAAAFRPGGIPALQAKNACALISLQEVQGLGAGARIGDGKPGPPDPLGSLTCRYEWGSGNTQFSLQIINGDASRMWPGMNADLIKQGLLGTARPGNKSNAAVISGIGEAAVFDSTAPTQAKTSAYLKGRMLIVTFEGPDARAKKDQVIALLKAAAARL